MSPLEDIFEFIEYGDIQALASLVKEDRSIIAKPLADNVPEQPLHYAVWQGQTEIALFLIEQGADVNAGGELDRTPLHYAAIHGRVDLAKILLEKGANPNIRDRGNLTPLYFAAPSGVEGAKDVARLLLATGAEADLNSLVSLGQIQRVCELLAGDKKNLSLAVTPSSLLGDAVAAVKFEDLDLPPSPEQDAIVEQYKPMFLCLLEAGVDINAPNIQRLPPLLAAAQENLPALVRFLLEQGADINYKAIRDSGVQDIMSISEGLPFVRQVVEEFKIKAND